jgi:hypothetical protein
VRMKMENFIQLPIQSTIPLRKDPTNDHSDRGFLSQ